MKKKFLVSAMISALVLISGALPIFCCVTSAERPKSSSSVVYIAPVSLYWLSKAGVPEAVEYVQYIDAEKIVKPEKYFTI